MVEKWPLNISVGCVSSDFLAPNKFKNSTKKTWLSTIPAFCTRTRKGRLLIKMMECISHIGLWILPQASIKCLCLIFHLKAAGFFRWKLPSFQTMMGNFVGNWMWNWSSDWKNVMFLFLYGNFSWVMVPRSSYIFHFLPSSIE